MYSLQTQKVCDTILSCRTPEQVKITATWVKLVAHSLDNLRMVMHCLNYKTYELYKESKKWRKK